MCEFKKLKKNILKSRSWKNKYWRIADSVKDAKHCFSYKKKFSLAFYCFCKVARLEAVLGQFGEKNYKVSLKVEQLKTYLSPNNCFSRHGTTTNA